MKKNIVCGILCIGMCLLAGCQRQVDIDAQEAIQGQETEEDALEEEEPVEEEIMEETIQQGDAEIKREYHFVLPDGWALCKTKQSEQSTLEIQGSSDEQYTAVIVLDKDLLTDSNIETYMNRYLEEAKLSYEKNEIGEIESFEANSGTAYKVMLEGTLENKVYANLLYVVDAEEHWYITTACSFVSKAYHLEKDMDEFVASFYKVEASTEDRGVPTSAEGAEQDVSDTQEGVPGAEHMPIDDTGASVDGAPKTE